MKNVFFSILVPVYNAERYLDECINSVINQTFDDWEMILVNDGSIDSSGEIADRYSKIDNRIRVFHKINGGQLHSRQYALAHAQGSYSVFLDADDWLDNNALEIIYQYIIKSNSDCIIFGYRHITNEHKIVSVATEEDNHKIDGTEKNLVKLLSNSEYNSLCRKAIKTSILHNSHVEYDYSIRQAEDLMQSIDIYLNIKSVTYIRDILYNYRINEDSASHTKDFLKQNLDIFKARSYVLSKVLNHSNLNQIDLQVIRSYYLKVFESIIVNIAVKSSYIQYKEHLNAILNSEYYDFISSNRKRGGHVIYRMIKLRLYYTVWIISKFKKLLSIIR